MRVLLDECVPRPLTREFPGHDVNTVVEMGWGSKRNSELLALMLAGGFNAFVTVDQNLEFQQNIQARSNRLKELRPLAPAVVEVLARIKAGELIRVAA
jgi:hypothetical protein